MGARDGVLIGHRVLITREYTADYKPLEEEGAELLIFPTIQTVPPDSWKELDEAIDRLQQYHWLVFTSSKGAYFFLKRLLERGRNTEVLSRLRICAVGSETARFLHRYGLKSDLIPKQFSAEGLIEAFRQPTVGSGSLQGLSFLLPRAETGRDLFPLKVRELGGVIDIPVTYRTIAPPISEDLRASVISSGVTIATFTSGSTFTNFVQLAGPNALPFLSRTAMAVIGPVTRRAVEKLGLRVSVMPEKATIRAMVEAVIAWAHGRSRNDVKAR
jgi:uroporphyrinogen III methyltransferase / synthase